MTLVNNFTCDGPLRNSDSIMYYDVIYVSIATYFCPFTYIMLGNSK
jgi:hypothetical protein